VTTNAIPPPTSKAAINEYLETWWQQNEPPPSRLVRVLRALALWAPFGRRIIPDRHSHGPYLLRTFLTPNRLVRDWLKQRRKDLFRAGWYRAAVLASAAARFVDLLPGPYLHFFFRGDDAEELHNHPFDWSCSLILTAGYLEQRPDKLHLRRAFRFNWISRKDFHRVLLLQERPWTIFLCGPRVKHDRNVAWGFLNTRTGAYTDQSSFKKNEDK
jgi:hypothetical protein